MSCKHEFVEAQGTKMDYEKNDNGRIETLIRRKVCWKCYKTKTEIDLEQQLATANARVAELEADLNESHVDEHGTVWTRPTAEAYCLICKAYDAWKTKAEQAEAQCAVMRLKFEQYARNKCKLIAQFKGKYGAPEIERGKCQGYAMSEHDDEPHYFCQECPACLHNDDDEPDAGTALLSRMKRMEDALREIPNVTSKCLSHEEMKDKMKKIAKDALEDKP